MSDVEPGDTVRWQLHEHRIHQGRSVTGEVIQTDLEKFGYTDGIEARTECGQLVHIRPVDLL
jgi:plastocyanin